MIEKIKELFESRASRFFGLSIFFIWFGAFLDAVGARSSFLLASVVTGVLMMIAAIVFGINDSN